MERGLCAGLLGLVTAAALVGCGDQHDTGGGTDGKSPLTARAVAAVALDHLPDDTSTREATHVDEHSPPRLVGADLRYGGDGEYDGDLVQVTVSEGDPEPCDGGSRCAELGDGLRLFWDVEAPEEDPGTMAVQRGVDGEVVTVVASGPVITGDPRDLDLSPSVDELAGLAADPRLRLTTSAEVVAAGEDLEGWGGGEREPGELDDVPHNDRTLAMGWLSAYGDRLRYVGPSPVKDVLGEGAIGGRVRVSRQFMPVGPGTIDVLAAPAPPDWLDGGCLDGYRCDRVAGVHLVWRSATGEDPGDAYAIVVRDDGETVAFHSIGRRLPERARAAAESAGVFMYGPDLTDPEYVPGAPALTTTRERFEQFDS